MPALTPPAKVLVTGANGFVAIWIVHTLLEHGFSVRGTVRSEAKGAHLRTLFKEEEAGGRFELVIVPDMAAPRALDEAVRGVDAIEHTASPVSLNADDPNELIEPAVKGTLGVLESALKHAGPQLKRVVVTSSTAAVVNAPFSGTFDERSWNDASIAEVREKGRAASQVAKYCASKTLAEKAAWDFVAKNADTITWDLVTICMPYVFGPVLSEVSDPSNPSALGTSSATFYEILFPKTKTPEELSNMQGEWVDVRDTSEGHVRALERPEAGGERFILSSGPWICQDWHDAANDLKIPGLVVSVGTPGRGKDFSYRYRYSAEKACNMLGMKFRDKHETLKDVVGDYKSRGWC